MPTLDLEPHDFCFPDDKIDRTYYIAGVLLFPGADEVAKGERVAWRRKIYADQLISAVEKAGHMEFDPGLAKFLRDAGHGDKITDMKEYRDCLAIGVFFNEMIAGNRSGDRKAMLTGPARGIAETVAGRKPRAFAGILEQRRCIGHFCAAHVYMRENFDTGRQERGFPCKPDELEFFLQLSSEILESARLVSGGTHTGLIRPHDLPNIWTVPSEVQKFLDKVAPRAPAKVA